MTRLAIALLMTLLALAAHAQTRDYIEADGVTYDYAVNEDGGVLTPRDGGPILYLGRSCDAYSPGLGTGSWGWANGGFVITLPGGRFAFGRQELLPNPNLDCWL